MNARTNTLRTPRIAPGRPHLSALVVALGIAALAIAGSFTVAVANEHYFGLVNRIFDADDPIARALLFSSWLVVIALPFLIARPRAAGLGIGLAFVQWRRVGASPRELGGSNTKRLAGRGPARHR